MLLAAALHNDLEPAALDLRPDLESLIERGEAAGALRGMVTGSGPTCVFLCESGDHARDVAAALDESVVLVANGPVAGAHLVEYVWQWPTSSTSNASPRRTACARCSPTSRSASPPGSGSASSGATATARPRCWR